VLRSTVIRARNTRNDAHIPETRTHTSYVETVRRILQICFSAFLLSIFSPALESRPQALPSCAAVQFLLYTILRKLPRQRATPPTPHSAAFLPSPLPTSVVTFNGSSRRTTLRAKLRLVGRLVKQTTTTARCRMLVERQIRETDAMHSFISYTIFCQFLS